MDTDRLSPNGPRKPKELRINAIEPIEVEESKSAKFYGYKQLIVDMNRNAELNKRSLTDDVCRIISIFYTYGNNIDRMLEPSSEIGDELRKSLATLKIIYDLKTTSPLFHEPSPTLARVAEAFPHVALVIADMLNSVPGHSLLFCVTPKDLGANVHHHFKLNYFSGLIDTAGWKAQIALFVHNLCLSKGILNTGGGRTIDASFVTSCAISARMMDTRLAPANTVQKFTAHIAETFDFDARSLNVVWDRVVGQARIPICGSTMLTPFHEQVLNRQPLNLMKWRQILDEDDGDSV